MDRKHKYSINTAVSDHLSDSDHERSEGHGKTRRRKNDQFKVRVLQKNLVYCAGFSAEMSTPEVLQQYKYLGQYGHIDKISTNKNSFSNKNQKGPSFSTYISFSNEIEAALAILGLTNLVYNERIIRACYGTTKYCTFFLKKQQCPNRSDCYFLHSLERQNEIDEGMHKPTKEMFQMHRKIAEEVVLSNKIKIMVMAKTKPLSQTVFPTISEILEQYCHSTSSEPKENPESPAKQSSECSNPSKSDQQISIFQTSSKSTEEQEALDLHIRRLILRTYLKDTGSVKSKLWFADNLKTDLLEKQNCSKQVKKYLVQHIPYCR